MNFCSRVFCALLCLWIVQSAAAQEADYWKQEISHHIVKAGTSSDGPSRMEEFYLNDDYLVSVSEAKRIVIKNQTQKIFIVDESHRTFLKTPIPYDPMNVLTQVSALRFLEDVRIKGVLEKNEEVKNILGRDCTGYTLKLESRYPQTIRLWVTAGPRLSEKMKGNLKQFQAIRHFDCDDEIITALSGLNGLVMEYEITERRSGEEYVLKAVCREFTKKTIPEEMLSVGGAYDLKDKITYADLTAGSIGKKPKAYDSEELAVLDVVEKFREGYRRREPAYADEWVEALFAEDAFVLGTDGAWPGTWEWRGGRQAAKEMFARDWSRWGEVKIFDDEIFVDVDGNAAWVAAFATVKRSGGDDDRSRKGSLARIQQYARQENWSSRRALYEIIDDASSVLAQYERASDFITPMRTEFGLVKRNGEWRLKMVHFSHPARGFRSFRLLNAAPELLENR